MGKEIDRLRKTFLLETEKNDEFFEHTLSDFFTANILLLFEDGKKIK